MSSSSTSSSSFFTAPDTPGSDPMETYFTEEALEKDTEQHTEEEASFLDVNVNVDDAAVLKEAEVATPGPLGGNESNKGLAARVHETATGTPGKEATMKVSPEEAELVQEAESRVVDAKDRMAATGEEAATPHLSAFPEV